MKINKNNNIKNIKNIQIIQEQKTNILPQKNNKKKIISMSKNLNVDDIC